MFTQTQSTVTTTEFDITSDTQAGLNWKSRRGDIENALKSGDRIKLISSQETTGYCARKFHRVNFSDVQAVRELVNNSDLLFTRDTPLLEPGNQGYFACSKKHINEILEIAKKLFHAELEHHTELTKLAAEQAVQLEEAADMAEYQMLLGQAKRLTELQDRFGGAANA